MVKVGIIMAYTDMGSVSPTLMKKKYSLNSRYTLRPTELRHDPNYIKYYIRLVNKQVLCNSCEKAKGR